MEEVPLKFDSWHQHQKALTRVGQICVARRKLRGLAPSPLLLAYVGVDRSV